MNIQKQKINKSWNLVTYFDSITRRFVANCDGFGLKSERDTFGRRSWWSSPGNLVHHTSSAASCSLKKNIIHAESTYTHFLLCFPSSRSPSTSWQFCLISGYFNVFRLGSNLSKCALTHFDDKCNLIYKLLDIISSATKFLLCSNVYVLTLVL